MRDTRLAPKGAAQTTLTVELDLWYIQNRTLALDLTILARTVVDEITRRTNAY